MQLSDFKELEFPHTSDIVYILYFRRPDDSSEVPFYVGESSRHIGRFGDYISAKFSAPTDYKIGEAIKYIRSFGFYIGIKYKETSSRKKDEKEILQDLRKHNLLLNDLPGFNYTKSERAKEKINLKGQGVRSLIMTKVNDLFIIGLNNQIIINKKGTW